MGSALLRRCIVPSDIPPSSNLAIRPLASPGEVGGTALTVRARQVLLGDDEEANANIMSLQEETHHVLSQLGEPGITKPKELLLFTRNLVYKKIGGQQLEADCMFCGYHINSTGATRIVDHMRDACVLCPPCVKDPCTAMRVHTDTRRKGKEEHTMLVKQEQDVAMRLMKVQKIELRQEGIKAGFKTAESALADQAIAKFFYANGLNFAAADCKADSYYREMVAAIRATPPTYVPPNPVRLAGPLMESAHRQMGADVAARDAGALPPPACLRTRTSRAQH